MENLTDIYLSVEGESIGIYREKASKFIAVAVSVSTDEEVKERLEFIRRQYHDANHHCYAYRLGVNNQFYRTNDDGEPSGSAGKPIYGQILSAGLSDILVVVVRYFGGTKLGIPGLIHAYKTATREALNNSSIIQKVISVKVQVEFGYEMMNPVMRILKDEHVKIQGQDSAGVYRIEFLVRKSFWDRVEKRLVGLRNVSVKEL